MATPSQLQTVQKEIDHVKAQLRDKETDLAVAQRAEDAAQVDFLRTSATSLRQEIVVLREKENILLQGQVSGQNCSPCYLHLGCTFTQPLASRCQTGVTA